MATAATMSPVSAVDLHLEMEHEDSPNSLDDLIRRKRQLEQNKKKYHLTEADCSLILTNANEFHFADSQVILAEGQEMSSLFRIKSGKVKAMRDGMFVADLPQGWFIGETLILGGPSVIPLQLTLIANGPVVISEVNVPFVRRLLAIDSILALKFYRNLASKLASIFFALNGNCIACFRATDEIELEATCQQMGALLAGSMATEGNRVVPPTPNAIAPTAATAHLTTPIPISFDGTRRFSAAALEFFHTNRNKKRLRLMNSAHLSYKVYNLDSNGNVTRTCKIKKQRIKLVSEAFGFKKKKTIEFALIKNICMSSTTSITILYGQLKARTLFFKDVQVAEEFMAILSSIVQQSSQHHIQSAPSTPLSQPRSGDMNRDRSNSSKHLENHPSGFFSLTSDNEDSDEEEEEPGSPLTSSSSSADRDVERDRDLVRNLADKVVLKKGDVLLGEGDLYQRLYSLTQGSCDVCVDGKKVSTIPEGLVFGEATLMHLRPSPVSIVVSSEEATILVIPGYKLFKLTDSNPYLSARLYRKVAQLLEQKITLIAQNAATMLKICPKMQQQQVDPLEL